MPIIVIDPGHGGRDPGAVGNGVQEKNLVLPTALKLRDALKRCGFTVIMTRETDTLPDPSGTIGQDLTYRAQLANRNNADLYISWHADSSSTSTVNGVALWIYPNSRGTRTNQWAERIVNQIALDSGQNNRGVYLGDFAVLRETNMDAVLVESGFITNPQDAQRLNTPSFQTIQAEATAKAICGIFNIPYNAPPAPTPPRPQQPPPEQLPAKTPQQPDPQPASQPASQPSEEEIEEWARGYVSQVRAWGVMTGYPDGTFKPNQPVTRAELATALVRLHEFMRKGGE